MLDHILSNYDFNRRNAHYIVGGLTAEQSVAQPGGLVNHPLWSIGHLALTSQVMMLEMGGEPTFPQEWMDRFFPGVPISGDVNDYPSMDELLAQLDLQHEHVAARLPEMSAEQLAAGPQMELIQRRYPRLGDFISYAMLGHEAFHIGQIACTRRALGIEMADF